MDRMSKLNPRNPLGGLREAAAFAADAVSAQENTNP